MSGYQHQEYAYFGSAVRTGTHPKVYKTKWGAWLALIFSAKWLFDNFRVVPVKEPVLIDVDDVLANFEESFKRQYPNHTQRMRSDGSWKCENCGRKNVWGTPTCRCRHKR